MTLRWFVWYDDAEATSVGVFDILRPLVFADQQVEGGRMVLVVLRFRCVVRTPFYDLLDVLRFDIDWHRTDNASRWRTAGGLEPDWTSVRHAYVEFLENVGVLDRVKTGYDIQNSIENQNSIKVKGETCSIC